jgi:hypothetical protein
MSNYNDRIEYAADNTKIIRFPKQKLSTFGQTNINYYMVTEPIYGEFEATDAETIVRQGYVIAEKPRIITPYYMSRLEGFSSEAKNYFSKIGQLYGPTRPEYTILIAINRKISPFFQNALNQLWINLMKKSRAKQKIYQPS